MRRGILVIAVAALLAHTALASSHFIRVAPASVARGQVVRVYGSVGHGCAGRDQVTLFSHAFKGATTHEFAGLPAIYANQDGSHRFSIHVRIRHVVRRGSYSVGGRCGGGNFGHATLTVR
jgi:hypothetical protein